jgi:hypothetical protein
MYKYRPTLFRNSPINIKNFALFSIFFSHVPQGSKEEQFIALMCKYRPTSVCPYLKSHTEYNVDRMLAIVTESEISEYAILTPRKFRDYDVDPRGVSFPGSLRAGSEFEHGVFGGGSLPEISESPAAYLNEMIGNISEAVRLYLRQMEETMDGVVSEIWYLPKKVSWPPSSLPPSSSPPLPLPSLPSPFSSPLLPLSPLSPSSPSQPQAFDPLLYPFYNSEKKFKFLLDTCTRAITKNSEIFTEQEGRKMWFDVLGGLTGFLKKVKEDGKGKGK